MKNELTLKTNFIVLLNKHLASDKPDMFMELLGQIIKDSIGMSKFSEATQLERTHSYKMLSKKGNPQLDTLLKTLDLMGFQIQVAQKNRAC